MRSIQSQIGWYVRLQWVLGMGLVAALLGYYFVGYRPTARRLETLQLQIRSKQRELDQNQKRAQNLSILRKEVQDIQKRVGLYGRQFPRQPDLGVFIRDLTQIGQQAALEDWKYQPGAPRRSDGYYELPITMNFHGDFLSVASFLRRVEDLQRMTRLKRLNIRSKDEKKGTVDVELTMNIYFSEG